MLIEAQMMRVKNNMIYWIAKRGKSEMTKQAKQD